MRIVVADCEVNYSGRLQAHLPRARRLLLVKADGSVLIHADAGAKALNWMTPPCRLEESAQRWTVTGARDERLEIEVFEIAYDHTVELGDEPGLSKTHSERELHELLAGEPEAIEPGLRLLGREYATDIGPVDLLCEDADGAKVLVEVKRVGDIDGVDQLTRYLERVGAPATGYRGVFVAKVITPQAKTLAASRGIRCVEVDFDVLAGRVLPGLTLF